MTGNSFDPASSALLLALAARHCGCAPGTLVHVLDDVPTSRDKVRTESDHAPRPLPRLVPGPEKHDLLAFRCEDVGFEDDEPWPTIKAPVAV